MVKTNCGYIIWDIFYSRTERCAELEKKTIVNINVLSLLLNYLYQILELLTQSINMLSFTSKIVILAFSVYLVSCVFIIYALKGYIKEFIKTKKKDKKEKKSNKV